MTSPRPPMTPADVGRFYDQMGPFLATLLGDSIHVGYWSSPGDPSSGTEAQERLTEMMIQRARVGPGQRLLDIGCGTGWPAIRLAQATGCSVTGISVSAQQVEQANARAHKHGLSGQVQFQCADAMELAFADASFDAVWAFESLLHMPDRTQVLRHAFRVLRPGGALVLTDVTEPHPLAENERMLVYSGLMIASLLRFQDYAPLVESVGFTVQESLDITPNTRKSMVGTDTLIVQQQDQIGEAYGAQFHAMTLDLWPKIAAIFTDKLGYLLLAAVKPA
ncbi:SAM-dependent methyltransferase [Stigmatella erecta]|uniref:Ubiquinone/menaquinone biosynthesis C-methylase UbiE n=1 Tax=Stigmatella erecta TaxID=83460 RepID=A0A1I0KC03_9BACT|nr:methyltransferase domain-containing protein [Stigmatella erecta]SEU21735.1 Ubiquinone/menaquinone biosynthesis C-methylase UbiE [Stigmatella erecta]